MLNYLLETASFLPHGFCLLWRPDLVALHVVSDLAIGLAYFSIPLAILTFLRRRPDFEYRWVAYLFAAFIVLCGTTHFAGVAMLWQPYYGLDGMIKLATGVVSVTTAALLWPLLPKIVALPSPRLLQETNYRLEAEIQERRAAEVQLRQARDDLERQVAERIAVDHALRASLAEKEILLNEKEILLKEVRRTEENFRLLVENVRDYAITWLDTQGRTATWNAGAERLYGWTAAEAVGQPLRFFFPPEAGDEADHILPAVRETGRYDGEGWRLRRDGSRFWAYTTITPLWDDQGRMRGYVRIAQDITERKRAEEELRRAKEEAERANVAKSRFLAAASHDLRQPVQAITFFTIALTKQIENTAAEPVLNDLKGSLEAIKTLLDSLLDVSRLDAGIVQPRFANFSLTALFDRIQTELAPLAADKRLTLRVLPTTAIIRSDPTLLERIVQNLVSNAIRYTERGKILVGGRARGQFLRIEVWDQGIGIPEDRLDDIFQEFYQVNNIERDRSQGLGLGLAIVQRLSNLLNYPVQVHSVLGRGSVFRVDVPLIGYNRQRNIGFLKRADERPADHKGLIVVIEDEVIILRGLKLVLEEWGYAVLTATGEAEALECLNDHPHGPDVIISDYRLRAGKTGTEAIRHLRARYGNRPIPSILITGDTGPERLKEAEASGYRLLHKPVSSSQLEDALNTYRTT
jgi:two-component system, sensor histidine kinase